jgi:hypothetical protein
VEVLWKWVQIPKLVSIPFEVDPFLLEIATLIRILGLDKLFNNFKALLPRALKVVSLLKQHSVEYQEALAVPNEILDKLLQITQLITLDDVKAWKLLKFAVLPLMAILARSKSCR